MKFFRRRAGEPQQVTEGHNRFDTLSEQWARGLASRFNRRSFLGQVGVGGITLAAGGALSGVTASSAKAHSNPCTYPNSVTCNTLTGSNSCPGGTCGCGYWDEYDGENRCGSTTVRWHDCCGGCGDCGCVNGHPTCCNHRVYSQGCLADQSPHIKCRHYSCPFG